MIHFEYYLISKSRMSKRARSETLEGAPNTVKVPQTGDEDASRTWEERFGSNVTPLADLGDVGMAVDLTVGVVEVLSLAPTWTQRPNGTT